MCSPAPAAGCPDPPARRSAPPRRRNARPPARSAGAADTGLSGCGTLVHPIPVSLATSIAAARLITSAGAPAGSLLFFLAIAGPAFPARCEMARLPGGRHRGKPNLTGVHAATIPSPHDRPRRQASYRVRRPKERTATQAAHLATLPRRQPARSPDQQTRLDTTAASATLKARRGPATRAARSPRRRPRRPATSGGGTPVSRFVATSRHRDPRTNV
jgi:hypothetical protein